MAKKCVAENRGIESKKQIHRKGSTDNTGKEMKKYSKIKKWNEAMIKSSEENQNRDEV